MDAADRTFCEGIYMLSRGLSCGLSLYIFGLSDGFRSDIHLLMHIFFCELEDWQSGKNVLL